MAYRIPWFYFGDTHCLIEGLRATESPQLATAYESLDFAAAQSWTPSDPPVSPPVISAYMQEIMDLPGIQGRSTGPPDFQWKPGPLRRLAVRGATITPSDMEREYILTPDTLYIPWPFFPGITSWSPPSGAAASMVSLDGSTIAGDHICLAATLDAVDKLAECPPTHPKIIDIPSSEIEQAIRDTAKNLGYTYGLGQFSALKRPGLHVSESRIVVDGTSLTIEIGAMPPALDEDTGEAEVFLPRYPCGAFTGERRPCD